MVILAAGTLGSPQLLTLSGIGPRGYLKKDGIIAVLDNPLVGQCVRFPFFGIPVQGRAPRRLAYTFGIPLLVRGPIRRSSAFGSSMTRMLGTVTPEAMSGAGQASEEDRLSLVPVSARRLTAAAEENTSLLYNFQHSLCLQILTCRRQLQVLKMEPVPEDFLLKGERFLTLKEYRTRAMPAKLLLDDIPVGQGAGNNYPKRLCPEAQRLFFRCIGSIDKLIVLGHLPACIKAENIVLTQPDSVPKLTGVVLEEISSSDHVDTIMGQLAGIFEDLIRHKGQNARMPSEVHNLLSFMKAPGTQQLLPLIKVPMENRGYLVVHLHQYIFDVLRVIDHRAYRFVVKEMVFDPKWDNLAEHNIYLRRLFQRGFYDPSNSQAQHSKYQRNGPCHALQDAGDANAPHGLRFNASAINHALYIIGEMYVASLQSALHLMGHLQALKTQLFFTWE